MSQARKTSAELKRENNLLKSRVRSMNLIREQKDALQIKHQCTEKKFKTVFEQSIFGNKIINNDLEIIMANKALVKILGYPKKQLVGRKVLEFSHPDYIAQWDRLRGELWSPNSTRKNFSIDTCLIRKDKKIVWCHVTSILFQDNGKSLGYTIVEDITERKDSERLKRELAAQENILRVSVEKHRQQKALFETFVKAQEEERERIAEQLHNGLGQMLYAVKLKLSLANPNSSNENTKATAIADANKLLSDSISECRRTAHHLLPRILNDFGLKAGISELGKQFRPAIEFIFKYESVNPISEKYYEVVIYRTVQELLSNIVKHAEATIATCKIKIEKDKISIFVKDNGKGLKPGAQRKKGIGLSSIKTRIAQMAGTVEITSESKKGTKVAITLPRESS